MDRQTIGESGRNDSIELIRIAGAIGIIWFHLHLPGDWAAYATLHAFVILTIGFGVGRPLARQARCLLVPWLIWCGVYGAVNLAQAMLPGHSLGTEFSGWMVFTGTSKHLWYLPFCLAVLMITTTLPPWLPPALMLPAVALNLLQPLPIPLAQWSHVAPAVVLGLWLASSKSWQVPLALTTMGAAALWAAGGTVAGTEQLALAAGAGLLAVLFPIRHNDTIERLASLSLGVYLAHPLFIGLLQMVAGNLGPWAVLALTIALSTMLAAVLKRVAPAAV